MICRLCLPQHPYAPTPQPPHPRPLRSPSHLNFALTARLAQLSHSLVEELRRRCAPAIEGLIYDEGSYKEPLCFFGIENSKGIEGDGAAANGRHAPSEWHGCLSPLAFHLFLLAPFLSAAATIRQLIHAIERGARKLPSLQQKVPLPWLKLYDALRRKSEHVRRLRLSSVRELCRQHGMPHAGLSLDEEMGAMLDFFRSLNAILWYDVPTLRELVILDPKWVVDAATCFIRDFKLKDHTER